MGDPKAAKTLKSPPWDRQQLKKAVSLGFPIQPIGGPTEEPSPLATHFWHIEPWGKVGES